MDHPHINLRPNRTWYCGAVWPGAERPDANHPAPTTPPTYTPPSLLLTGSEANVRGTIRRLTGEGDDGYGIVWELEPQGDGTWKKRQVMTLWRDGVNVEAERTDEAAPTRRQIA
jgi:hypothetical protein